MHKIKKILRAVSEKTALPTNQPIIANNTDLMDLADAGSKNVFREGQGLPL